MDNLKKDYLRLVKNALNDLKNAHLQLEKLWNTDSEFEIDLNDALAEDYPYDLSFNEIPIQEWVNTSFGNINSYLTEDEEINNTEASGD